MKTIEIKGTPEGAVNYQLDDGRIFRLYARVVTPASELKSADYVTVETKGIEITDKGDFVVGDDGFPVLLEPARQSMAIAGIRAGYEAVHDGFVKVSAPMPYEEEPKALKSLPKTGTIGQLAKVGDELYRYTQGQFENVRRQRLAALPAAATVSDEDQAALARSLGL